MFRITFRILILMTILTTGVLTVSASSFIADDLVKVTGDSPFADCTADAGQPGTNFLNSEVEPWIDVNPTNPNNIVGAVQQDRWSNGGARGLVATVSTNGGSSWQSVVIPGLTLCSGGTFQRATDPWLSFAPNGDLYFLSLVVSVNPGGQLKDNAMLVSKSTDGGLHWSSPITLVRDIGVGRLDDKNSITVDPTDSNFVYAVWARFFGGGAAGTVAELSRTTDGGQTWEPPRAIYISPDDDINQGHQIVVLPDETVIDAFTEIHVVGARSAEFLLTLIQSTDKGETWGGPIRAAQMLPVSAFDPESGAPIRDAGILLDIAVDSTNGNLYLVWQDRRFTGRSAVAFSQSIDGGLHWSAPIKVNQTPSNALLPGNEQAFVPSVDVAADGTIAVTYYDFRNNDAEVDLLTDYFVVHCHADCREAANWGDELQLTDVSFDMRQAPLSRGFFLGDYEGLASDGSDFVAFFSQPHGSDPASVFFRRFGP